MHYDTLPFGKKWRDSPWPLIDTSYLQWILYEEAGANIPGLWSDVREELRRRGITPYESPQARTTPHAQQSAPPPPRMTAGNVSKRWAKEVISAGRKSLARTYHPDVNKDAGAISVMQDVNASADWLEKCLAQLPD